MERAGQSLWGALRRVARPEKPLDLLVAVWPLMVGKRLAGHTHPCAWHKGRVDVAVDEPGWHKELQGMSKDVRTQINRWWGSELVTEVRFVTERRGQAGAAFDESKPDRRGKSAAVSDKSKRQVGAGAAAASSPAANKLRASLKELEPALRAIGDAELRDLIARVAGQYLDKLEKK